MRPMMMLALALVSACGRIDFGLRSDASSVLDGNPDAAMPVAWVKPFVATTASNVNRATDTFSAAADHAGDAILLYTICDAVPTASAVTMTAPGWTFAQLGAMRMVGMKAAVAFAAIAPDTLVASFSVTWNSTCNTLDELGDELAGNDATGGTMTFDAAADASSTGNCAVTVVTASERETVWGACSSSGTLAGPTGGYTKGADNGADDMTAYRATADPAGTAEMVTFANTAAAYTAVAVTIRPASP